MARTRMSNAAMNVRADHVAGVLAGPTRVAGSPFAQATATTPAASGPAIAAARSTETKNRPRRAAPARDSDSDGGKA